MVERPVMSEMSSPLEKKSYMKNISAGHHHTSLVNIPSSKDTNKLKLMKL